MTVRCVAFRERVSGRFLGWADLVLQLDDGSELKLLGCSVFDGDFGTWVALPATGAPPSQDRVLEWPTSEAKRAFEVAAAAAINAFKTKVVAKDRPQGNA